VKDGKPVFSNARVFVGKPEIDFFFNEDNQKKTGYGQNYFDVAQKTLKPYLDAGKVVPFSGTSEILPGITGTVHPGHTRVRHSIPWKVKARRSPSWATLFMPRRSSSRSPT
jgi:hypothetical protein